MIPVSIVVLTRDRRDSLLGLLDQLERLDDPATEVVVVDNGSADGTAAAVAARHPGVTLVALPENVGVGARNRGLQRARGEIVITLDDDMIDLDASGLARLRERFAAAPTLAAVCFKVTWPGSPRVRDWVHRRPVTAADDTFPTYEITEGAVAWRRAAIADAGWFREDFFISHEGVELAFRLLDRGWDIVYDGAVSVGHAHAAGGRANWRRHYYDTRNLFWVATLHMPAGYATRYLARCLGAMLAYSIRDGHLTAWLRAVRDGLSEVPRLRRERRPWTARTRAWVDAADVHRPGFWTLARRRLRQKDFSMD